MRGVWRARTSARQLACLGGVAMALALAAPVHAQTLTDLPVRWANSPAPLPASSRELALELFRSISTALSPSGAAASRMELRELGSEGSSPAIHCIQ